MSLLYHHLSISSEVLSQTVSDETVLLDLRSEKYFGLDVVGSRVWKLLQEMDDVLAIRDQLLKEFDVTESKLDQDLNELLGGLLAAGLVREVGSDKRAQA